MPQCTRQSGKGNCFNTEDLVCTRAKAKGTSKLKLVWVFSEGPDTVFTESESLSVCHVVGDDLFVGGASVLVKANMELVTCTIALGAFLANIEPVDADRTTTGS